MLRGDFLKSKLSYYLGDLVYGANDGIITTFAVVSGAAGAGFSSTVIIVLGIANLIADGFSMGASRYLSLTSEQTLSEGASERDRSPASDGTITFGAFVVAGSLPLVPFLIPGATEHAFAISAAATAVTFFVVGAARSLVTTRGPLVSGLEMLIVGGIAATIAYGLGAFVQALIGASV